MIEWIPCELHTHTLHSDGSLTLMELARKAKELELACIALTDHNTISGHEEIPFVSKETGLQIVHGLEWTTFYGHMVAMGIKKYVDWRDQGPLDIQKGISNIHNAAGLAGVAHPYRMGSPMCTGCYWQFEISDWAQVDYIEVWSETFPSIHQVNHRAFRLWTELLDQGFMPTAVSGRDWHGNDNGDEPIAVTYLGIDRMHSEDFDQVVLDAIANRRAVSTMGPMLNLLVNSVKENKTYVVGEVINPNASGNEMILEASIDLVSRKNLWNVDEKSLRLVLVGSKGKLLEKFFDSGCTNISRHADVDDIAWVRAELFGTMNGKECMIGFTNPVYFQR